MYIKIDTLDISALSLLGTLSVPDGNNEAGLPGGGEEASDSEI